MDVDLHLCGTDVLLRICTVYICFMIVTEYCDVICVQPNERKRTAMIGHDEKFSVFLDVCGLPAWWKYNL